MDLTDGQVTLEKEIQLDDLDKVTHEEHILTLEIGDSTSSVIQFASITKDLRLSVLSYDVSARNLTQAFVNINEEPEGIANSLYQYLGFTEEELTAEQFKNGLKNAILAYKDGPIA